MRGSRLHLGVGSVMLLLAWGCGEDASNQGGGSVNPNYGNDSGGDSSYDAPNLPDGQGQGDAGPEAEAAAPLCVTAADCDDDNECTTDSCDPATGCAHDQAAMQGEACGDSDACTTYACAQGECVGTDIVCNDDEPCTEDTCDPASGCVFDAAAKHGDTCDDGNICTNTDRCLAGQCAGIAVICNDHNGCTADACDPASGCVFESAPMNGTLCDDDNACTTDETCVNGACSGIPETCDDHNACTVDTCDPAAGCAFDQTPMNGQVCNDGDACTIDELCQAGVCSGTLSPDLEAWDGVTGDGVPDSCDNCPTEYNPDQLDSDGVAASSITFAPESMGTATTLDFNPSTGYDPEPQTVPIGFSFSIFGSTYTDVIVNPDPVLSFDAPIYRYAYYPVFPCDSMDLGAVDMIALAWGGDVNPVNGGTVTYNTIGTAPDRKFVVFYDQVPTWGGEGPVVTVQGVLFEGSNRIEIHTYSQPGGQIAFSRGVTHNDFNNPLAAYLPGDLQNSSGLTDNAAAYTTSLVPEEIGDACANRADEMSFMCMGQPN